MKKRRVILALTVIVLLAAGYVVGWHTWAGRFVRGVSSVGFVNRSGEPLQYVSFYLSYSSGQQISRHFEYLQPQHSVVVRVRTSDLVLERIVCEQGKKLFTYDQGATATPGEVFLVTLDSQGKMSHEYGD